MPVGSEENKKNTRSTKPEEPKPAQWIFPSRESAPPAKNLHSNICILMQCECKCGCVCVLWVCLRPRVRDVCASSWPSLSPPIVVVALLCRGARADSSNIYMQNKIWKRKAQKEKQKRRHSKTEKSKGKTNNRIKLLGQRICSVKQINRFTMYIIESKVSFTICKIT